VLFSLAQSSVVQITLTTTGAGGAAEAVVRDFAGREVGRFVAGAGRDESLDVFLPAGAYTVTVRVTGAEALDCRLGVKVVTDPIGVRPEDPTAAPAPVAPPTTPNPPVGQPPRLPPADPPVAPPRQVVPVASTVVVPVSTRPTPPPQPVWPALNALQLPPPGATPPADAGVKPTAVELIGYVWWY
jgi:hypothetical protein